MTRRGKMLGLAAALAATLTGARGWAAEVVSPKPEALAVTIYRDDDIPDPAAAQWGGQGLAMIRETRTVDLPAGESRVVFQGVADGTLPQTAALSDLPGRLVEQNFDFDLLSPGSLLDRSIGARVQVVRTNPKTGKETAQAATLRSGAAGAVLDFGDHVEALKCDGAPERLVFDETPPGLTGHAALSSRVRVAKPGRYRLTLAYLTVGLAWKADYVARVAPGGRQLDLSGWITLANHDGAGFANATTSVVAGRLARQMVEIASHMATRAAPGCWPTGNSHHPRGETRYLAEPEDLRILHKAYGYMDRMSVAMPAPPAMQMRPPPPAPPPPPKQSDLGDYKLYTLSEPTTVAARQTKQVLFLNQPRVSFDTAYVFPIGSWWGAGAHGEPAADITLRLENKAATGLGRALPAGKVSLRQRQDGAERMLGEAPLRDVAVDDPFELVTGQASDVRLAWRIAKFETFVRGGRHGARLSLEAIAKNAGAGDVSAEVRALVSGRTAAAITAESQPHGQKAGDPVWRLAVPAHGETPLSYTLEYLY